jgi:6,7-dimethyl-8-ribityllumazine synthase
LSSKNLSQFDSAQVPDASAFCFGIVTADWNKEITDSLYAATFDTLLKSGCKKENIIKINVPGSFELTAGAQFLLQHHKLDVVICLGCVIQGETPHFTFICNAVAQGLTNLTLKSGKPVIFGVLTTDNLEQAKERAGGKLGNKGTEAAVTAIKMAALKTQEEKKKLGF